MVFVSKVFPAWSDQPQSRTLNVGFSFVSEDSLSVSQGDSDHILSSEKDVDKLTKVETSVTAPHRSGATGGTRAGLSRTPISGGVQSATSAHGLP